MKLVCLDLEGVLVPEIWIIFAEKTGIDFFKRTTRDEPDYNVLMKERINALKKYGFTLKDILNVIEIIEPLEGALLFLDTIRSFTQIVILSDTFEEFAAPLMKKLKYPTLFCNSLVHGKNGMITDYKMRLSDGKRKTVESLKNAGCSVFSAGDSYNDLSMIKASDSGVLFRAPELIHKNNPELRNIYEYSELIEIIKFFCTESNFRL